MSSGNWPAARASRLLRTGGQDDRAQGEHGGHDARTRRLGRWPQAGCLRHFFGQDGCAPKMTAVMMMCLALAAVGWGAVPPPPRDVKEIQAVLAEAPSTATGELRQLNIVLVANRKDHGPHEHDYPRWMDRWNVLLGGRKDAETTRIQAVNVYGPPSDLSKGPQPGAKNVTVETAVDWPTAEQFAKADLIVTYMGTGGIWNEAKLRDLKGYLDRGGGFVTLHSACIAEKPHARPLAELIGLAWEGGVTFFRHGALPLKIAALEHPICKGLPQQILFEDETYWPLVGDVSRVEVLATAEEKALDSDKISPEPMFWTYKAGKGRIFNSILGHYSWTFDDPYFRILALRGMAWAAGESPYRFDPLVLSGARTAEQKRATPAMPADAKSTAPDEKDPELLLWLDASDTATLTVDALGHVSAWLNKADRIPQALSASDAQQPLFAGKGLGGKPAVKFDGVDDVLRDTNFEQSAKDWTVVYVVTPRSNRGKGQFHALMAVNKRGENDYETGFNLDLGANETPHFSALNLEGGKDFPGAINLRTETAPFGEGQIIIVSTGAGRSQLWVNGVEEEGRSASDALTVMDELRIGGRFCHSHELGYFHGDVSEVLVYGSQLTADQRSGIYAHLVKKYGSDIKPPISQALDAWDYLPAYDWSATRRPLAPIDKAINEARGNAEALKALESKMLPVLVEPSSTPASRDYICRRLAIMGTAASVPALAALLKDEQLSNMACFALENIRGAAADEALVQALNSVPAKLQVGLINTLGRRKSPGAVEKLTGLLGEQDPLTSQAVPSALVKIGTPAAATALTLAFEKSTGPKRDILADSCLRIAQQSYAAGRTSEALALYERLSRDDVPETTRIQAIRGSIVARGSAAVPQLIEQLKSDDPRRQVMAMLLVCELPGDDVTKALSSQVGKLPPENQARLITALADRNDAAAKPAIVKAVSSDQTVVRAAAIEALGRLGDVSDVSTLLGAAAADDKGVVEAVKNGLSRLSGQNVDATILETLNSADPKVREVVIYALGRRAYTTATPALMKLAGSDDSRIRSAAVKSLGDTMSLEDVPALLEIFLKAREAEDIAVIEKAFMSLYARIDEKDAWADALLAAVSRTEPAAKLALLRALSRHGGPRALQLVKDAAENADAEFRDGVVRILCDWPNIEAADDLLRTAKESNNEKHRVLALRGYLRLASRPEVESKQRLAMAHEGAGLAKNDEERRLVIGTLGDVPTIDALNAVLPFLDMEKVKEEAGVAVIGISGKLPPKDRAAATGALEKAMKSVKSAELLRRAEELLKQARESGS